MHPPPLLDVLVAMFGLALPVVFLCHLLRIPAIIGFLLTGMLVGPHGIGLIGAAEEVNIVSEIGVVLLLFTIGMEFSIRDLVRIRTIVLVGGTAQIVLTVAVAAAIALALGRSPREAIFVGLLLALSSTAIVLRLLQERNEMDAPHGRTSLGVLIFQDLAVVPMIVATPYLAGGTRAAPGVSPATMLGGVAVLAVAFVAARWFVPRGLYQVARSRSDELFLLAVAFLGLATAWLTAQVGLSLALGAFLAGLIIAESEYSHRALGSIANFRDLFTSFFFISIGMLMDIGIVLANPIPVLALAALAIGIKIVTGGAATLLIGFPARTALLVGFALAQLGEFAFVLARAGREAGILADAAYQVFLAVTVVTMLVAPFLIAVGPRAAEAFERLPMPARIRAGLPARKLARETRDEISDHLVIVGFGVNGRNVARAAAATLIPYLVIEMNPETVREERKAGQSIFYGDASQETILRHAGIERARVLVVTIPDATAARRIVETAHRLSPEIRIIARTRYVGEVGPLHRLGADDVIAEEHETSLEVFARVLGAYLIPREEIEQLVEEARAQGYEELRALTVPKIAGDIHLYMRDMEVATFHVDDGAPVGGRTIGDVELRKRFGVTVLAIRRGETLNTDPDRDTILLAGDFVLAIGRRERIADAAGLFRTRAEQRPHDA